LRGIWFSDVNRFFGRDEMIGLLNGTLCHTATDLQAKIVLSLVFFLTGPNNP